MAVVRLWLGAELRRRWRSHAVLALLIGIVGAVILTVGAGARRTASAYDRYIDRQSIPTVEMDSTPDEARAAVAALPGVKAAAAYSVAFAAPAREGVLPGQDAVAFAAVDPGYGHTIDRPIVVSGRLPRIGAADEAAVNESAAAAYHLRPGSVTSLRSMAADEGEAMFAGRFDKVTFHGPTPTVRVVGVVRSRLDLGHVSYARNYLFTTPAFAAAYREQMFFYPPQLDVRLADPAKADRFLAAAHDTVAAMSPDHRVGEFSGRPVSPGLTSIRDSTRVQALPCSASSPCCMRSLCRRAAVITRWASCAPSGSRAARSSVPCPLRGRRCASSAFSSASHSASPSGAGPGRSAPTSWASAKERSCPPS